MVTDETQKTSELNDLSLRIEELGGKATQLLTFLSFALVVAVLLRTAEHLDPKLTICQQLALKWAMRLWTAAIFPIVLTVFPVKEFSWGKIPWYRSVRLAKVLLLRIALISLILGTIAFLTAIW